MSYYYRIQEALLERMRVGNVYDMRTLRDFIVDGCRIVWPDCTSDVQAEVRTVPWPVVAL